MQLTQALKFNEKVQSIALAKTKVPVGAKLQMVGWMEADSQKELSANLKQVTLTTIDSQECQSFHEKKLSESEFCTVAESESNYCKVRKYYENVILKKQCIFVYPTYSLT